MMSIFQEQNSQFYLGRLRAASFTYSQAKKLGSLRVGVAVLSAAIAPFFVLFVEHSDELMAIVGGALTFICEVPLERLEDDKKLEAARIQEQFDTGLFNLPWSEVLVGGRVTEEIVLGAARRYKGDYKFTDWYADPGLSPYPYDVLLCQRANLVWDFRQRRFFSTVITILTISLFVCGGFFAAFRHLSFLSWLAAILIPSLPALIQGIKAAQAHTNNAREKEALVEKIHFYWHRGIDECKPVGVLDCRAIQDLIFVLRKTGPMVPDRWFEWLRDPFENDMKVTTANMKVEAEKLPPSGA